jgi:hypothetical protein
MRWKVAFLCLAAVVASQAVSAKTCTYYSNSTAMEFPIDEGGPACASTGPGCNECTEIGNNGPGGSATSASCFWSDLADIYCYYYGNQPEMQIP